MIRVELLGIFEDLAQQDFLVNLVESMAVTHGYDVVIERRLTSGCRPHYLREHLEELAPSFAGVLVGVDGGKLSRNRKIAKLSNECPRAGRTLWSVAQPSVEEWLMADAQALPQALRELFGDDSVGSASRPGHSNAESTAKKRLREWVEGLLGAPTLRGGVEYAADVARKVKSARVGTSRNPDLLELLAALPGFLEECAQQGAAH